MIAWWWLIPAALAGSAVGMVAMSLAQIVLPDEVAPDYDIESTEGPRDA